jgi:hypothetical protein
MFFAYGAHTDAVVFILLLLNPSVEFEIGRVWLLNQSHFGPCVPVVYFKISVKPKVTVLYSHIER